MSYHDELDDLHAEILAELYRRHIRTRQRALALAEPEKLRLFLQDSTIRHDAQDLPLSSFLRRVRIGTGISLEDFAGLLELPVELLEQLETNYSVPWSVTPSSMADVASLFRIHVTTLQALAQNSSDIAYFSGHLANRELANEQMKTWLAELRQELERRQSRELLD